MNNNNQLGRKRRGGVFGGASRLLIQHRKRPKKSHSDKDPTEAEELALSSSRRGEGGDSSSLLAGQIVGWDDVLGRPIYHKSTHTEEARKENIEKDNNQTTATNSKTTADEHADHNNSDTEDEEARRGYNCALLFQMGLTTLPTQVIQQNAVPSQKNRRATTATNDSPCSTAGSSTLHSPPLSSSSSCRKPGLSLGRLWHRHHNHHAGSDSSFSKVIPTRRHGRFGTMHLRRKWAVALSLFGSSPTPVQNTEERQRAPQEHDTEDTPLFASSPSVAPPASSPVMDSLVAVTTVQKQNDHPNARHADDDNASDALSFTVAHKHQSSRRNEDDDSLGRARVAGRRSTSLTLRATQKKSSTSAVPTKTTARRKSSSTDATQQPHARSSLAEARAFFEHLDRHCPLTTVVVAATELETSML